MATLQDYARFYISGDPAATTPTDESLELLADGVIADLYSRYPCLTDDPETELSGTDRTNFRRGAGALVAQEWRMTRPQAGESTGQIETEVTIGPVRERVRTGQSLTEEVASLEKLGQRYIRRITCVWQALTYLPKTANRWDEDCCEPETSSSSSSDSTSDVPESATIITVQSASSGTGWAAFPSATCDTLDIVNNTGTDIEYRRGGAGYSITIPDGSARAVTALSNASEVEIRRVDQSTTQVSLTAEAIVE